MRADRSGGAALTPALDQYLHRRVVLDTQGPLLYIGRLESFDPSGYWLSEADVHDRNDGHSGKERYINEAHELEKAGARHVNRRLVFVERHAVVSVSALDDVVILNADDEDTSRGNAAELPGDAPAWPIR